MKKVIIALVVIAVVGGGIYWWQAQRNDLSVKQPEGTPTSTEEVSVPDSFAGGRNIELPKDGQVIDNPLVIKGRAMDGETFYRLVDVDNNVVLAEGRTSSLEPGQSGYNEFIPFEISVPYETPEGARGKLEIFGISGGDGSEINKLTLPLGFKSYGSR
ncbi:MAG: Gmad2 immunoglobulin-like domain-containing protein [Candidatus Doudnabacteria bacterium]|nr:Gmad2 immunoglobulin-like domain-containing protein [bacterium]MDZ4243860.1 Gmad2 immunoglobulin-like domain-containing protein [Candidatus Doudnabacteria bacterium]